MMSAQIPCFENPLRRLDRTDQILQYVFNLHAFSLSPSSITFNVSVKDALLDNYCFKGGQFCNPDLQRI